jgi:hypothetical protein
LKLQSNESILSSISPQSLRSRSVYAGISSFSNYLFKKSLWFSITSCFLTSSDVQIGRRGLSGTTTISPGVWIDAGIAIVLIAVGLLVWFLLVRTHRSERAASI